jgi:hypothetical protein
MKNAVKYPRTPHLPWSPGGTSDDAYLVDVSQFEGRHVVVTEKMDGENTTLYRDGSHARSIDSRHHSSRDWVKAFHSGFAPQIPEGWRFCGENVYALHSVAYGDLPSFFLLFSIWDERNHCLSWDETIEWSLLLSLNRVPEIYRGPWDERKIRDIAINEEKREGYVVRIVDSFPYQSFAQSIGKWVRPNHVQTDEHWMSRAVVPNQLKKES